MKETLRAVPLFADLSEDDLDALVDGAKPVSLEANELLFAEGDEGDVAYVVTAGEVEIVKVTAAKEVLLAVRGEGSVIGEMALFDAKPRSASVRARSPVELLSIGKDELDALLESSASASRSLFEMMLTRLRQNEVQLRQTERMAQLGTLTAGLAHELNNPAAAVRRGANQLRDAMSNYVAKVAGSLRRRCLTLATIVYRSCWGPVAGSWSPSMHLLAATSRRNWRIVSMSWASMKPGRSSLNL